MTVLHLVKTARGATWALRQVAVLRACGIDVAVALPPADGARAAAYRALGATVLEVDLDWTPRAPWRLARAMRGCRDVVARVQPDVIHSHFVSTTVAVRLALGRGHPTPRVFQVPGPLHLEHALPRRLDLTTAGPCDHWIASCRWTQAAYVEAGVDPARVALSYYGADLSPFRAARRGAFRHAIGVTAGEPLVGMVAWMYAPKRLLGQRRGLKGHEDFLAAFAHLRRLRPDVRGVVVGGAWAGAPRYEQRLRRRAERVCGPALRFTGPRRDVPSIYADLDVAAHPSLSENCGGAVESLAAACPTVATDVGGLPDVVVSGETGWLVPPRDPAALAAALAEALARRDEARRRARAGRALVERLFAVERTGREVAAFYRRLVEPAAPIAAVGGG